eukprot:1158344-Pelagomonas_calceolata.AAC.10
MCPRISSSSLLCLTGTHPCPSPHTSPACPLPPRCAQTSRARAVLFHFCMAVLVAVVAVTCTQAVFPACTFPKCATSCPQTELAGAWAMLASEQRCLRLHALLSWCIQLLQRFSRRVISLGVFKWVGLQPETLTDGQECEIVAEPQQLPQSPKQECGVICQAPAAATEPLASLQIPGNCCRAQSVVMPLLSPSSCSRANVMSWQIPGSCCRARSVVMSLLSPSSCSRANVAPFLAAEPVRYLCRAAAAAESPSKQSCGVFRAILF